VDRAERLAYHKGMKSPLHLFRRLRQRLHNARRRARFAASLQHLHGPSKLNTAPGEVVLITLVRDGSYYLDAFFRHYRAMGVQHFVFIDNGSRDDTIARIKAQKGTVIDRCTLPLAEYEDLIRQYPAQTYGKDRWCLYVDMDEIFDFEGRSQIGIKGLTAYLDRQGYTALAAQMLEMFSKTSLAAAAGMPYKQALQSFLYYDISAVRKIDYHSPEIPFSALLADNELSNEAVKFAFGGVRGKVFGEDCCLTKHPLIFNGPEVTPAPHPHLSSGVRVADMTAVIKHYKFANDAAARDAETLGAGNLSHGEDARRMAVIGRNPDVSLFSLDARRWNRVELLYRAGFLVPSEAYSAHVAAWRDEHAA